MEHVNFAPETVQRVGSLATIKVTLKKEKK